MTLKVVRFINLILAALLVGNEFGTWVAVHPALGTMPTPAHVRAEQALVHRYGKIMPVWMTSVIVSCLPVATLARNRGSSRLTLAGMVCFIAMLISTLLGNVPINNRVLELAPDETSPESWRELREQWDRLHTLRILLNVVGLSLLQLGALREEDRR